MKYLIDLCILLLYCLCSQLFLPIDTDFVIAFFLAVCTATFLYIFSSIPTWPQQIRQTNAVPLFSVCFYFLVSAVFAVTAFFLRQLILFLPLAAYFFYPKVQDCGISTDSKTADTLLKYLPAVSALGMLLYQTLPGCRFQTLFFVSVGCILSVLLRQKTESYEHLSAVYRKTHDDDTEIKLLLQEKNQTLLDKQNYELYAATLKERNRIAQEIHDNVGHMLTRSILMVGALKAVNKDTSLSEPLSQLDVTLNHAMDSIRESVHDLHESSVNLENSLRSLTDGFMTCPVRLHCDISDEVPAEIKYCFIAITKEALVNISRHSNATAAEVSVQEHPAFYRLSVKDNGTIFSSDSLPPGLLTGQPLSASVSRGIGLTNMQNRLDALHGTLKILTEKGFCIFATIPKSKIPLQATGHQVCSTSWLES